MPKSKAKKKPKLEHYWANKNNALGIFNQSHNQSFNQIIDQSIK